MKRLLLFLLFLSPFFSEAQTSVYHPFPEDSAMWCDYSCTLDPPIGGFSNSTYELNGKVLINSNWYSRMLSHSRGCDTISSCSCFTYSYSGTGIKYIRQDTAQKKVWLYNSSSNSDTIFLDFNLHVGDTLNSSREFWAPTGSECIVSSVDSALVNGQYRKRYNYHRIGSPSCIDNMIEGIGPSQGFYPANDCFEHISTLVGFFYPWQTSDTTGSWYYCYGFATEIKMLSQTSFSISPNPAHDKLNVDSSTGSPTELKIYDVTGREVYSTTLNSKHETLNLSLSPALYFVRVGNHTQKLVIE